MKQLSGPRKAANLPGSVHQQLNMYALAASAAGVGMLALAQPAEAKIVYTPDRKWLPLNQRIYLDLNHDGVNDFHLLLRSVEWSTSMSRGFVRGLDMGRVTTKQSQNAIYSVISQNYACAAALTKGKRIGPNSHGFKSDLGSALMFSSASRTGGRFYLGPWLNLTQPRYVGLKFAIKGKIHYGWARLAHVSPYKPATAELTGYAYETIPNKAIIVGNTSEPDDAEPDTSLNSHTPEPSTLGALARGTPGLSIWRRDDSFAATPERK